MTSTTASPEVIAASRPWALYALGQHVADHELPFEQQSLSDRLVVWVLARDAHRWRTTNVTETGDHAYTKLVIGEGWHHAVTLILHGSCVQITLAWITYVDHHDCEVCGVGMCACRDLDELCSGRVSHACSHGLNLCPTDAPEGCSECREGRVA